jgi:rhamnosyltransferase
MTSPVSIVMRSKNDGPLIGAVLRMVYDQDYPGIVELVHIDSGSTDNTVPEIKGSNPWKLIQIKPEEYVPGVVLNRGMRESRSDWVVFLNSDAEPVNRSWLSELLAAAMAQPKTGTAFSQQVPRPDCQAVFAHDYDRCFGPQRDSVNWEHFFSMVSCVVNRRAWEEQPFREDLQYAEDDEWSRRLKANGWGVIYAEKSLAIHSHNYTFKQAYKRCYGDSFALAATKPGRRPRSSDWIHGVILPAIRDGMRDWSWCARNRRLGEWPCAFGVRVAQRMGKTDGFRAGWHHYHGGEDRGA